MPLKQNRVQVSVEERGDTAVVTMAATFEPRYGFLGTVMAKLIMESRFRETFEEVIDGLEAYALAHGEDITRSGRTDVPSE